MWVERGTSAFPHGATEIGRIFVLETPLASSAPWELWSRLPENRGHSFDIYTLVFNSWHVPAFSYQIVSGRSVTWSWAELSICCCASSSIFHIALTLWPTQITNSRTGSETLADISRIASRRGWLQLLGVVVQSCVWFIFCRPRLAFVMLQLRSIMDDNNK